MSLSQQLQQALAQLNFFSAGEQSLAIDDGARHLSCHLTALDSLACAFTHLSLASDRLTGKSAAELKQIAEKLSARLTYLLEPISPIETDALGCVVQMRSNPPHQETDRTTYYELLVARAGTIGLSRYSRAAGQPRALIAAQVTREVLARLVEDFAAALD